MDEFITAAAIMLGVASFFNAEKLRKRLNLTQDILIKNDLIEPNDLIPGWRERENKKTEGMTNVEREKHKLVKKLMQ